MESVTFWANKSIFKTCICFKRKWFLKNKIDLISKDLEVCLNENKSLKKDLDTHVCHASVASSSSTSIACSTLSSSIKNDINVLKKTVDCLGSTLSHCAMNHTSLESMFRKNHAPHMHAHHSWHTHAHYSHTHDSMHAKVYTCTHCDRAGHLAKFCYVRLNAINFASKNIWSRKATNPMDSRKFGYQNPPLLYLM